jgi:uncharacterized protein YkwD
MVTGHISVVAGAITLLLDIVIVAWDIRAQQQWMIEASTVLAIVLALGMLTIGSLAAAALQASTQTSDQITASAGDIASAPDACPVTVPPDNVTPTSTSPQILSFASRPANINLGETADLSWTTIGTAAVTLDQGIGHVPVSGNYTVVPHTTTAYQLTATNPAGSVSRTVTVTVGQTPSGPPPPSPTITVTPTIVTTPPAQTTMSTQPPNTTISLGITAIQNEVLRLVNLERQSRNAGTLTIDSSLSTIAVAHSGSMAQQGDIFHSDQTEPYAENVWMGSPGMEKRSDIASIIVNSFMNSPYHRTWLLCPNLKHVGVGILAANNGVFTTWSFWRKETIFQTDWWYCNGSNVQPGWMK